ncbi:hypothetical protein G3578_09140 [Brevibacillus sp. SYP-B805]|uniref:S-layer homology domain-containing protein n=1 Tax=Brevibacillus sp. SYP-B805 TaxID=1578199 RepID=UPI0013EAEFEE|nr:S-layer homology domain-containing protein [Brevibacillus sp. SYP-B805]NGQ95318.1 hypothetical protein [Brevibacillus sp. SYP-B805]
MGKRWVDIHAGQWFYNEIMEATNYYLEDGEPLVAGMTYDKFDSPRIYEEFQAAGQATFTLPEAVTPTGDNPLYVFIDGVKTIYKSVNGNTVELYAAPKVGSTVSFFMPGKPALDADGRPVSAGGVYYYPSYTLNFGGNANLEYYYNPFDMKYLEYLYAFGRALKRANVQAAEWTSYADKQELLKKYIGYRDDIYAVDPNTGTVYVPYSLNNVSLQFVYTAHDKSNGSYKLMKGTLKATSSSVSYNDRFFPDAKMTRAEGIAFLDRLRQSFYQRFTDAEPPKGSFHDIQIAYTGQKVFRVNGAFNTDGTDLVVRVDAAILSKAKGEYTIIDDRTVLLAQPLKDGQVVEFIFAKNRSKFSDVSNTAWYYPHVIALEMEYYNAEAGRRWLLTGRVATEDDALLVPDAFMTRAEAVSLLNRFRHWGIQKFKL